MLNYETILSSYDDRLTLLQWLKKVEAALANASFENFEVVSLGDATYKFKATFADGSEIESNEIRIGERISSAYIGAGNTLHLVTESGDDIDAGAMFNGDLNVSGNVSATGKISAPEIEQIMSGFTFLPRTFTGTTLEFLYAGVEYVCHKATFVVAFKVTTSATTPWNASPFRFIIPHDLYTQIAEVTIGNDNCVLVGAIDFVPTISTQPSGYKSKSYVLTKYGDDKLDVQVFGLGSGDLTVGTEYYGRCQFEILFSDNLAA